MDRDAYPNIKFTKYGNATILGEMHELGVGLEYEITANEQVTQHGYGYRVVNIRRDKPHSAMEMYEFLHEILTPTQAETLYTAYPDIIDRVVNDNLDDIDFSTMKGIKEKTFQVIVKKIRNNYCLMELVAEFQDMFSLSTLKNFMTNTPLFN